MRKMVMAALAATMSCGTANAAVFTYYGIDPNAGPTDARPNADAARASFIAATSSLANPITFESLTAGYGTGVYTPRTGVTISLTNQDSAYAGIRVDTTDDVQGFNTTAFGSKVLTLAAVMGSPNPGLTIFNFATPISAFGSYITGLGTANGNLSVVFNDGSQQSFSVVGSSSVGTLFFGFTDADRSISSVTLSQQLTTSGSSRDIFAVDDVLYGTAISAVPESATWALMIVGFGVVGASMRRRRVAIRFA